MPSTFTTTLPDAQQPSLGNGVEDEVSAEASDDTNYGDYRFQIRETGQSSWGSSATGFAEAVVASDGDVSGTISTIFSSREDGEEYEVRARTETEHVTGAWTSTVAIITKFPGATGVQVDTTSATSVTLFWTDNSDNEDGFIVERREQFRDGFGSWRERADLAANTTSYTDVVQPNTTYEYRIEAYTEDAAATSGSIQTTADDDGIATDRIPAEGWHVVIEDTAGNLIEPTIVDDPMLSPALNDLPTVEIPVTRTGRWDDSAEWERQPMRVYHDGQRQPIEEVQRVRQDPGRAVLIGVGGVELRERVSVDVIEDDAHLVADNLLTNETDLVATVDDPSLTTTADLLQQQAGTEAEWDDRLASPPASTDVYDTTSAGRLATLQTAYFGEAEDGSYQTGTEIIESSSDRWSGGRVVDFETAGLNVYLRRSFSTDHDIPESAVGVAVRIQQPGDGNVGFDITLDGTVLESIPADALTNGETEPDWFQASMGNWSGTLAAGDHTLEVDFNVNSGASDPSVFVDCMAIYDDRHDPGFSETVSGNVLEGPDEYPTDIQAQTIDAVSVRQVVGGRLASDWNNTTGSQAVAISNDSGGTWIEAGNAETVMGQFGSGSTSIRARFTLGGYDSDPSTSPAGRTAPQSVDLYSLYADLENTPLLANRSWEQSLLSVLQDIASYGNFIFEVVWDNSVGALALEWTQAGQRTGDIDPDLVDYSAETDYSSIHRKAIIYGTSVPKSSTISAQHDSWVALDHDWLQETGETVEAVADGTEYERGVDYEIKPNAGELQALSTGASTDGEKLIVRYPQRIRGTFVADSFDATYETFVDDVPAITTGRNADAAALALVQEASEPLHTASVTISASADISLVEAIDLAQLPVDEPMEVWAVENSPRQVTLQLGSREQISETISRIEQRLGAASRKV